MTQRKRILVPVKPTLNHNKAVDAALMLAKELKADLHFVCILHKDTAQISRDEAIEKLAQNTRLSADNKINATCELLSTDTREKVGEELSRIAEKFDLVIIGHTQYDQIYRFLHRSPVVDIINKISVPVVVVPDEKPQEKKV